MNVMLTVAVLFMFAIAIKRTDGACCYMSWGRCGDCTRGTPYCGYYRCNLFGCNCGGGCRQPSNGRNCWRRRRSTENADPARVFHGYDLNKDGKIEKDEFFGAFNSTGSTNGELLVHWEKMDENRDDFITIEEFDHDN